MVRCFLLEFKSRAMQYQAMMQEQAEQFSFRMVRLEINGIRYFLIPMIPTIRTLS